MTAPRPYQEPAPLDPRLVTKTSLPKPKEAIALFLILWFANNRPGTVVYGRVEGAPNDGGIIDDAIIQTVGAYSAHHGLRLNDEDIKNGLKGNPLLESQMESLNSTFELVWHLGSLSFTDGKLSRTSERTGGIRYQKRISFSSNLDLIGILEETAPDKFAAVLVSWLTDGLIACDSNAESKLVRMLSVMSETALYKTSKGETGTIFAISGVYDALLRKNDSSAGVDVVDPGEEVQGTTRILKLAIEAGLFPELRISGNAVTLKESVEKSVLDDYVLRIRESSQIASVKLDSIEKDAAENRPMAASADEPRNLIFFGAPGTGKSYQLNKLAKDSFAEGNVTRVTFYPDYTYSQFVGCFKPAVRYEKNDDKPASALKSYISYEFVPGPFLETYVKAVQNPDENYLLIVEEINRANPAAVFGEVFQLLDRDASGRSEYEIAVPREMRDYFELRLPEYVNNGCIHDPAELLNEEERMESEVKRLSLPPNMYIWATMNSADQGVFPMDTAFKRRWDFRYMGINEGEDAVINGMPLNEITVPCGGRDVLWNNLRRTINEFMTSDGLKINEDKLLGPFFISPAALTPERFASAFKDKVLLYLYEDAGKTKHSKLFKKELDTYSKVCEAFGEIGEGIFGEGFDSSGLADDAADLDAKPAEE